MFEKKGRGGKRNEREEENEGKINGYDSEQSEVGVGACDFSKRVCASNALSRIIHYFCYHVR